MIPAIIHYCWFGNEPKSKLHLKCIDSWKKYFPMFQFIEWNESNFNINYCVFSNLAYVEKKYAFVSDVARFYALKKFGGIYLDLDMLIIRDFPKNIFELNLFVGKETKNVFNAAIIGASKDNFFINFVLDQYIGFSSFSYKEQLVPRLITEALADFQEMDNFVSFSPDYFYPLPYQLRNFHYKQFLTDNSLAVHMWDLSWKDTPSHSLNEKILNYIKYWLSYFYIPTSFKDFTKKSFYSL